MNNYAWVEIVFVAAVTLGIGGWQLVSINREIARDRARKADDPPED